MPEMKTKNNKRSKGLLCLLYIFLATLTISVTFAKYIGSATVGDDTARVAVFDVDIAPAAGTFALPAKTETVTIMYGATKDYTFTLTNNSEVSVTGKLTVTGTHNQTVTMTLNGSGVTVGSVNTLNPGANTVVVTIKGSTITSSAESIKLRFDATQKD